MLEGGENTLVLPITYVIYKYNKICLRTPD